MPRRVTALHPSSCFRTRARTPRRDLLCPRRARAKHGVNRASPAHRAVRPCTGPRARPSGRAAAFESRSPRHQQRRDRDGPHTAAARPRGATRRPTDVREPGCAAPRTPLPHRCAQDPAPSCPPSGHSKPLSPRCGAALHRRSPSRRRGSRKSRPRWCSTRHNAHGPARRCARRGRGPSGAAAEVRGAGARSRSALTPSATAASRHR
jgi:hypothetical protein